MLTHLFYITFGLILLTGGAEVLVRGSASLALRFGLTPLVVGLTVVAFGTSSPELLVSTRASLSGNGAISLGNVIGSNICNIALILGLSSLIRPMCVQVQIIRMEIPILIMASGVFTVMLMDKEINRIDALILFSGIILYTIISIYLAKKEKNEAVTEEFFDAISQPKKKQTLLIDLLFIVGGLAVLIFGAELLIKGSVAVAHSLGISQIIIGLTIVALGTSLPELATSVIASFKKEGDIAIGNVIGSNIFNIGFIVGVTGLIQPVQVPTIQIKDLIFMVALAVGILPLMRSGFTLSRIEGILLLSVYVVYIYYRSIPLT